ncbi:M12 family metallopeptidase [Mesorhizobium sp. M1423]|uniref:M12 family metallopeptidase n=1 Tax=Mesorhizobium sp. M1423 TaxID=2957101 RepID=UPI0033384CC4
MRQLYCRIRTFGASALLVFLAVTNSIAQDSDDGLGTFLAQQNAAQEPGGNGGGERAVVRGVFQDVLDYAYPSMAARWRVNPVAVCWENGDEPAMMDLVRNAVEQTWSRYSNLKFIYWGPCDPASRGIRIVVADRNPRTLGLGNRLDGVPEGMLLNFAFQKWSPICAESEERRSECIYVIAVHEFGHAVGFAHEQNRQDTPDDDCFDKRQGTNGDLLLTPWDIDSVMNYCNPIYGNNGELSDLDKFAVEKIYEDLP